jgi:colanic acid/amylovoran biosynthesis glycosyltransferase
MENVVHYLSSAYLPKTEPWIYFQLKNISKYRVIVYSHGTENPQNFPVNGMKLRAISNNKKLLKYFSSGCNRINFNPYFFLSLARDKPSVIHAHFGASGYHMLSNNRFHKCPLVTTFYGFDVNKLPLLKPVWRQRYARLFRHGDKFLVEGPHMKKCLAELGCPEEKIVVQYMGVDVDMIPCKPRVVGEGDEIKILMTAAFREKKGFPYGVEAFCRLAEKRGDRRLKLTIIGDSSGTVMGDAIKKDIHRIVKQYDAADRVTFRGFLPYSGMVEEMYRNHIFLHPSVTAADGDTEGGAPRPAKT